MEELGKLTDKVKYNLMDYLQNNYDIQISEEDCREITEIVSSQLEPPVSGDFGGEYTQGICEDGAVILYDGKPMTPELIVAQLNELVDIKKKLYYKIVVSQNSR